MMRLILICIALLFCLVHGDASLPQDPEKMMGSLLSEHLYPAVAAPEALALSDLHWKSVAQDDSKLLCIVRSPSA